MEQPQLTTTLFAFKVMPTTNGINKQGTNTIEKKTWSEIYHMYENIKELCCLVNQAFGSMVTVYLAAYLMFQATSIDQVLTTPSFQIKVQLLFFIMITSTIFWLSADVCNKVCAKNLLNFIINTILMYKDFSKCTARNFNGMAVKGW